MEPNLHGTELLFKADLRDLLTTPEIRETVLAHLAPRLSCGLVRQRAGLGVIVRDDVTGTVAGVAPLRDVLIEALAEGTLTHNAADRMNTRDALDVVAADLESLLVAVREHRDLLGEPEEGFGALTLEREPAVERELEEALAHAG